MQIFYAMFILGVCDVQSYKASVWFVQPFRWPTFYVVIHKVGDYLLYVICLVFIIHANSVKARQYFKYLTNDIIDWDNIADFAIFYAIRATIINSNQSLCSSFNSYTSHISISIYMMKRLIIHLIYSSFIWTNNYSWFIVFTINFFYYRFSLLCVSSGSLVFITLRVVTSQKSCKHMFMSCILGWHKRFVGWYTFVLCR